MGVIGTEYSFDDFPLNIRFDWMPLFNMFGFTGFAIAPIKRDDETIPGS